MLEYLASLRQHGCSPQNIGTVTIGRTVYAAGSFLQDGQKRIALMPIYRTDKVTASDVGPTPDLLPASYRRSSRTIFVTFDSFFYISGWNKREGVLWLNMMARDDSWMLANHRGQPMEIHFREPFEVSLSLASNEVLARIAAQS